MESCCVQSFVAKGFREAFRLSKPGATHTCESCGRRYVLARNPEMDVTSAEAYQWAEITH
jgi:hypothetical protein